MASITNDKGFTVQVATSVPVGFSRKGVVTGNTVTTVSKNGSHFGIGSVSVDDLRTFANDILASLPADDITSEPAPVKGKRAAKETPATEA